MTRIAESDFNALTDFLAAYRVPEGLGAQARFGLLKRSHRHVLAGLQVWRKLDTFIGAGNAKLGDLSVPASNDVPSFLGEHFSDVVGSLSCAIHGVYKPANFMLRSSVENLIRGLAGVSSQASVQATSVYKLFEIAAGEPLLSGKAEPHFRSLQQIYGDLCLFVHSGSTAHRDAAHELANHFKQDTSKLRDYVKSLERVNRAALSILVIGNPMLYTSLHHRAQDLLDDVLSAEVRLTALGA